jgi:HD-like signal output (HDOD) protein
MAQAIPVANIEHVAESIRNAINQNQLHVPVLPKVAQQVLSLTQDPDSSAGALSQLIQGDQSLAAHVMRIANSAAYSPNGTIQSLQQATARLGMQTISEIALAATINGNLFQTPGYEAYIAEILRTALATGLWAKEVARTCRKNVESAFLVGLLVDIGRPVVVQSAIEQVKDISPEEVHALETELQALVGAAVIASWDMPKTILSTIENFEHYDQSNDTQTQIVVAASVIANGIKDDVAPNDMVKHPVFALLDLYPDDVESILAKEASINSGIEAMTQHG